MLNIDKKLYDDIAAYCKLNEITDIDKFCSELLNKAFTAEKYGRVPNIAVAKEEPKQEEPKQEKKEETIIIKDTREEKDDYYDQF